MEEKKLAVVYCRVSTKEQVEEGNSLATQEKICRDYAVRNGFIVSKVFIELGESAKTADRTELKKLMAFCTSRKEQVKAVIVYRLDRLSRQMEDYTMIKSKLRQADVEIKSTAEFFEDNPAGRFMENIIANVAQFDNDVRTERSVNGMRDAVREGRYVWKGPIGYSNGLVNGKSNIVPNKYAPMIQEAFASIATSKLPVNIVWRNLVSRWSNGDKPVITKSHFHTLVKNEVYAGWINKFNERNRGSYEALISQDLYDEVQYQLGTRKKPKTRYDTEHPDFPLRKFFFHPSGLGLTGGWCKGKNKKYPYYFYHIPKHVYKKDKLEEVFLTLLDTHKLNNTQAQKLQAFIAKHITTNSQNEAERASFYNAKIATLKQSQTALIQKNLNGILPDHLLKNQLETVDIQIRESEHDLRVLAKKPIVSDSLISMLTEFVKHPSKIWKDADFKRKLKLQWFYFPQGVIWDGIKSKTLEISFLFKLKEEFQYQKSSVVHQRFSTLNNTDGSQSSTIDESILINQGLLDNIQKELLKLQEIVSDVNSNSDN